MRLLILVAHTLGAARPFEYSWLARQPPAASDINIPSFKKASTLDSAQLQNLQPCCLPLNKNGGLVQRRLESKSSASGVRFHSLSLSVFYLSDINSKQAKP